MKPRKRFAEGDDDPKGGGLYLYRAFRGLPKYGPVIKFLSEPGVKSESLPKAENYYLQDQERNMKIVDERICF